MSKLKSLCQVCRDRFSTFVLVDGNSLNDRQFCLNPSVPYILLMWPLSSVNFFFFDTSSSLKQVCRADSFICKTFRRYQESRRLSACAGQAGTSFPWCLWRSEPFWAGLLSSGPSRSASGRQLYMPSASLQERR